jgi:heat shock protein HslJ
MGTQLRVTGYCNSFSGSIGFGNASNGQGSLSVFITSNTNVMCALESNEIADQALISALTSATSYRLERSKLTLLNAENAIVEVLTQK